MNVKLLFLSFFMLSVQTTYANYASNYIDLKNQLLMGAKVKIIANLKTDCTLESHNGSVPHSPNAFGMMADTFEIRYSTGDIVVPLTVINAPIDQYGANYENVEMFISSTNEIKIAYKIVALSDLKTFDSTVLRCRFGDNKSEGVKFVLFDKTPPLT